MNLTVLYILGAFVFGLVIGSFLNVCIVRLPEHRSIVHPPSSCPRCGTRIAWYDNIPVISFFILGRKCRSCSLPISWRYPFVEFLSAVLAALLVWRYGPSARFAIYYALVAALIVITFIDIDHQIIPNEISLPGIVIGFLSSFINPDIGWVSSGIGIIVGGGCLLLVIGIYYLVTKREGMGGGDVKLLAMIGAFLGIGGVFVTVLVGSIIGSIVGLSVMIRRGENARMAIAFGPFLSLGALTFVLINGVLIGHFVFPFSI
jgi:leader peptidase (prepilin peptidase) / N-methyltransferase